MLPWRLDRPLVAGDDLLQRTMQFSGNARQSGLVFGRHGLGHHMFLGIQIEVNAVGREVAVALRPGEQGGQIQQDRVMLARLGPRELYILVMDLLRLGHGLGVALVHQFFHQAPTRYSSGGTRSSAGISFPRATVLLQSAILNHPSSIA